MSRIQRGRRTVAIVQRPPVLLDLAATLDRAVEAIEEAADADLVVFPETWVTGYPAWVFGMAGWGDPEGRRWYGRLLRESPVVGGADDSDDDLAPVRAAARRAGTTVVLGINERSGGTLYNSLATVGPDGRLLNLHRKLVPTHTERIVWAQGDGAGLRAVDTPAGRVGGLVCWEHWMPLARQALHSEGEQIHVAAWPDMPELHELAARTYAREGAASSSPPPPSSRRMTSRPSCGTPTARVSVRRRPPTGSCSTEARRSPARTAAGSSSRCAACPGSSSRSWISTRRTRRTPSWMSPVTTADPTC
ncbi:nitrilase-related carbon-nitrogen hydrolase [Naasia aerilata]|uniref:CN hydrolase domain-containing protein n=1 Tax=Naasia aerilata TaxID=1162966 RepID=A0ABM8GBM0_9MICO|nr:nitrilase-related carbon-nitrogen hydrolase [Naasia aerilata]BDZ45624.1 hypothetical protein GCM10025866_15330 [Naasia aerilata]